MLDGIDGSGKGTIINAWKQYLTQQGNGIFDLEKYWLKTGAHPELSEIKSYDFVFSCEPTNVGVGQSLHDELLKNNKNYPAISIAHAFSLDRLILYQKILIPLLKQDRVIISDRGVSASLAYQPLQDKKLTIKKVAELPGNKLALKYAPQHLILLTVDPAAAIKRLKNRLDKQDDAIFEKLNFLKKLAKVYRSPKFLNLFKKRGTTVHFLSANENIDIIKEQSIKLLQKILTK